jgi:ribosomal protein S18 acetylase RimI-like enzyme
VITIRQVDGEQWTEWRVLRRAALAEAPEAFGSTLEDWSGDGDTEDRWRRRLSGVPLNLVAELEDRAAGMVSATAPEKGSSELISMWVAPDARGKGVGNALVSAVADWARRQGAERLILDVRAVNSHAVALYERCGFRDVGWASPPGDPFAERRMSLDLR